MKRLAMVASMACIAVGATACTREKPPVILPTPAGIALQPGTPILPSDTRVVSPTLTVDLTPTVDSTEIPTATAVILVRPTASTSSPVPAGGTPVSGTRQTSYTVQLGDWLSKIAPRFGVTTQAIVAANPGMDPNHIIPGQVINIPSNSPAQTTPPSGVGMGGPITYTVQRGDWFSAIARKFGVTAAALRAANPGVSSAIVYPGQVLNIPASSASPTLPAPGAEGQSQTPTPTQSEVYTVQPGDSLLSIAVRFHTTPYALQMANHLANPNFVYTGQRLVIP